MTLDVLVSNAWRRNFPGAHVGLLALDDVRNPTSDPHLSAEVQRIESRLRQRYAGLARAELAALPNVQPYVRHYKNFGQTYHVLRQLESVACKGKPLASPSALVLAMFAAELESMLLTAGHDLDALQTPVQLDVSGDRESFVGIGGQECLTRPGDMLMRDQGGIISAVIYGPDQRTRLHYDTRAVLFTTYAPEPITTETVMDHLERLEALVQLVAPDAPTRLREVYPTT